MALKLLKLQKDNTLSCSQKLDKIQNMIQTQGHPSPRGLCFISDIFEDCVNQEHGRCLETAYLISKEANILATSNLGRGLEAIGTQDINAVNQFIQQKIQVQDLRKAHYVAPIIPHIYRGQENEMAQQMQDWYQVYSSFFFRALKDTQRCFLEDRDSKNDFDSELQIIQTALENIANNQGVDPSDAYQGRHRHDRLLKISLLLDDLEWNSKNTVDYNKVDRNLSHYPNLEHLLTHNKPCIPTLQNHNQHPLTNLLRQEQDPIKNPKIVQTLTYYDHCLEPIAANGQNNDPLGTLRKKLLGRPEYNSTIAEIEAINVLRRKFGIPYVDIEKAAPNGKEPDIHIITSSGTIWGEVTIPRPQISYQVAQYYSMRTNPQDTDYWPKKSYLQKQILNKIESQIQPIKEDTGDLTMLVIKNEESKVDNETLKNFVLGRLGFAVPQDSGSEPVVVRGETGLEYDDIKDYLDILVLFDTLNDLSNPPFIEGQVANLTDVDQAIIGRLVNAFNADELTPP
jgi:hypothetical protein